MQAFSVVFVELVELVLVDVEVVVDVVVGAVTSRIKTGCGKLVVITWHVSTANGMTAAVASVPLMRSAKKSCFPLSTPGPAPAPEVEVISA